MKDIKFRAWHKKEKKMCYFLQLQRTLGVDSISDCHDESLDEYPLWMQFTGLRDKNGKDVYESDILGHKDKRYSNKRNMLVKYDIYYCEEYGDIIGFKFDTSLEVIGNKFENPKLYEKVNK